jgi:hypothetical protein
MKHKQETRFENIKLDQKATNPKSLYLVNKTQDKNKIIKKKIVFCILKSEIRTPSTLALIQGNIVICENDVER